MNKKNGCRFARVVAPLSAMLMLAAGSAQAASISYFVDQSNALPDGVNYLQVTISDGIDGAIDVTVETLQALRDIAGNNFGIQSFGFNLDGASAANISNLPGGWTATDTKRLSEFGFFDVRLAGTGKSRVDTLTFSIVGIDGDTPEDYAHISSGKTPHGNTLFAAHVAGFDFCASGSSSKGRKVTKGKGCANSSFFGGSTAVPLPAAAWLFATGLAGVLLRARKRR